MEVGQADAAHAVEHVPPCAPGHLLDQGVRVGCKRDAGIGQGGLQPGIAFDDAVVQMDRRGVRAECGIGVRVGADRDVGRLLCRMAKRCDAAVVFEPGGRRAVGMVEGDRMAEGDPLVAKFEEPADTAEDADVGKEGGDAHGPRR